MITVGANDIIAVFRPLTSAEIVVAMGLIEQAITQLKARVPGLDSITDPDKIELARVAVVNAVKRVLTNPSMMKQVSRTSGPFTEGGTFDDAAASGSIEFTASDLYGLIPAGMNLPGSARLRSGYPLPRSIR